MEAQDLYQDLFLYIITEVTAKPSDNRAYAILKRFATKKAWEYRNQALRLTAQYSYRPIDVRRLCQQYLFNPDYVRQGITIDDQPRGDDETASSGVQMEDRMVIAADVQWAFSKLNASDQQLIRKQFQFGDPLTHPEKQAVSRAIDKMTNNLNYYRGAYWIQS